MVGANDDRRGDESWDEQDDDRLETEQLELNEPDERLPWLESAGDDDGGEYEGYDTSRMLLIFVVGMALLAAVVGGIWWFTNRGTDPELVADGSVVAPPAEPYKTAPANPGGKTFDGTGDVSFAASEGQSRPPALAGSADAGTPSAAPAPTAAATQAAPAATSGGVGVQVGAFSSQATAEAGWTKLVAQAGDSLAGVSHRVVAGTADDGTIYRLQAVAPDKAW
ncbi:MAG: hypothetical protein RL339_719, partial [Pseudomonadota bacterium]